MLQVQGKELLGPGAPLCCRCSAACAARARRPGMKTSTPTPEAVREAAAANRETSCKHLYPRLLILNVMLTWCNSLSLHTLDTRKPAANPGC